MTIKTIFSFKICVLVRLTFQIKALNRIIGTTFEGGKWKIWDNNDVVKDPAVRKLIKLASLWWLEHARRMGESEIPWNILLGNPRGTWADKILVAGWNGGRPVENGIQRLESINAGKGQLEEIRRRSQGS